METKTCSDCRQPKPIEQFKTRARNRIKGGVLVKYVHTPMQCKECENKRNAQHMREFRATPDGKTKTKEVQQRFYQNHKEDILAFAKSERGREIKRKHMATEKWKASYNRYHASEKGWAMDRAKWARKTAKKYELPLELNTLTNKEVLEVGQDYGFACAYCRTKPSLPDLTLDHVQPLRRGGPNTKENVVPACAKCNHKKQTSLWAPHPKIL